MKKAKVNESMEIAKILKIFNKHLSLANIIGGGEKMDLETVKNMLGWNSPIGVGIFFVCSGLTAYFLTLALQNIVNL